MIRFNSFQQHKVHYQHYLILLVLCLLTFWSLTFGVFSVKNDAIHYYLPYRFQVSEAIRNGEWPFWSPYVYLGYPILGDMQSGTWNPVVWFFSLLGRYDLTSFHFETLLYIFLAGVGMYKLSNRMIGHAQTSLLIAASYMLSGFMINGQLINWLSAAAFFPFVIHYFLETLRSPSYIPALKTGIALFLLFTTGYPSFFIITGYILLGLFIIKLADIFRNKKGSLSTWKKILLPLLLIILVFLGLAAPAIVSYIDLLPYYQRGDATTYQESIVNSFEMQHLASLVFPSAIQAYDIVSSTDITCRNVYPGLFALVLLLAIPPAFNRKNILLAILAIGALLFSLGDATPVRKICYNLIPMLDTFRHPSQMRLFFVFALLLLASGSIKKLLNNELSPSSFKKLRYFVWITAGILLAITCIAFLHSGLVKQIREASLATGRSGLKDILDNISLNDAIAVNGLVQLLFMIAFGIWLNKGPRSKAIFIFLWLFNLFLLAQPILPATFVSKTSPREINRFIHASPKGFPVEGLNKSLAENSRDALAYYDKIAVSYFYNKKIGISPVTNSPSFLTQQEQFLKSRLYNYVGSLPVIYLAATISHLQDTLDLNQLLITCNYAFSDSLMSDSGYCDPSDTVLLKKISPGRFEIYTNTKSRTFLVLSQNFHHHWKLWIDGKPAKILKTNLSFMSTPIGPGKQHIIFKFVPSGTLMALWAPLITVILLIVVMIGTIISARRTVKRNS